MTGHCLLIQTPAIDFNNFLAAGNQITGLTLSAESDASSRELSDTERFLSCLKAFGRDSEQLLMQVSFSMLVVADERDLRDVLEYCCMPFVTCETISRGIDAAVIHGTLSSWKVSIIVGMQPKIEPNVRALFAKMLMCFEQADLGAIWKDCKRKDAPVGYYLEHKP